MIDGEGCNLHQLPNLMDFTSLWQPLPFSSRIISFLPYHCLQPHYMSHLPSPFQVKNGSIQPWRHHLIAVYLTVQRR